MEKIKTQLKKTGYLLDFEIWDVTVIVLIVFEEGVL